MTAVELDSRYDNRYVKEYTVTYRLLPNGQCLAEVRTKSGVLVETLEAATRHEAEVRVADEGYQRVPPDVASEIDDFISRYHPRR